jgi:hypothetical protein
MTGLTKKDAADYGPWTAIVREKVTQRTARIEVVHPHGRDIFEYDDSSERRDQFRNALVLCEAMQRDGKIRRIVELVTDPALPHHVTMKDGIREW